MKTSMNRFLAVLFMISLALALPGCRAVQVSPVLGILSAAGADNLGAGAQSLGQEQMAGFDAVKAEGDALVQFLYERESVGSDEVQVAVRRMVEKEKVLALVGGTSNEATMRAAALVNFFNLPMIVPTAGGDNLLPSNNLWAFRLSAPGSDYAIYTIDTLLSVPTNRAEGESISYLQDMKIAILYEENTFGESAAVAAAHAAMRKEKEIAAYHSFKPDSPNPDHLRTIIESAKEGGAQVAILISSSPASGDQLVMAFDRVYGSTRQPVLIGLAGGFASREFLASDQAGKVFVVRQLMVRESCPAEIDSLYAAQTYAALTILEDAMLLVQDNLPEVKRLAVLGPPAQDPVIDFRERLRDELKVTNRDAPCIGRVAFDNAGQLKDPRFELVLIQDGVECACAEEEFQARLQTVGR